MSKNPREELDEVFIKSQRLAHFADAGSSARYMNRNVAELNEATKLMAEKIESSNSRSLRTLATEDLSAKNLLSQVNSIRLKSKGEPARLETTSMEGYLAHHREMIVLTAIEESRRRSDEYLEASRRRWNAREWEAAKASFMESLGHRAQSWGKTTSQQASSSSSASASSSSSSSAAAASSSRGLPRTISSQVPPVFVEHRNAIRAINVADHSEQRRPIAACSLLLEKASLLVAEDGFMTENDIAGYTLTLEMLRAMVGEGPASNAAPCVPGKFAAVCFDAHVVEEDHQHALRRLLRRGGQRFLEDQALAQWTSVVSGQAAATSSSASLSAASLLGHSYGGGNGEARAPGGTKQAQVRSYVAFLAATNALPAASLSSSASAASAMSRGGSFGGSGSFSLSSPLSVGGRSASSGGTAGGAAAALPLWPFVYHCLRSGQLSLAIDELREHHAHKAHAQHALVDQVLAVLQIVASVAHVFDATDADDAHASSSSSSGLRGGRPRMARDVSTMMDGRELKTTLLNLQEQYRLRLHAAMTHATTTPFGAASGGGSGGVAVSASEAAAASASAAGAVDVYLLTVLNLVSGANRTAFTECHRSVSWLPPSCDLFDLLWASLWFIGLDAAVQTQFPPGLFAADLGGGGHRRSLVLDTTATATASSSNALATSAFGGGAGTGDVNTQQGEAEFLDLVYGLAAEHFFDRPELRATAPTTRHNLSATFRFVLALVACHRFGDAIHHLWLQGQVFAAVHLACLGLHYGWLLPHQPLLANPSRPRVQHAYATHVASVTQLTPLTIVQLFVRHPLLTADVALVSDYLVTLPLAAETLWQQTRHRDAATRDVAKSQAQEATAELLDAFVMSLADVDSVVALVGGRVPATTTAAAAAGAAMPTVRQGYLRQYFSERQLHAMVVRIADRFRRQRDARRAIDFYRVAGHVKDAVVEFCGLLALHWAKVDETYASHFHAAAAAAAASNAASNAAATALSVRSFWRQAATAFALDVDRDAAAWTALDQEAREYVDFLKQLLRLYDAVDALLLQQAPLEALRLVDALQLVPCPDAPATSATPPRLVAATVLDDVVLFVAQCVVSAYQHWQRHVHVRALGIVAVHPSSGAAGGGGVEALKLRWKLLMDFARDVKRLLRNPQTVLDLVQLDTSFKW